jgi:hypothetical protein
MAECPPVDSASLSLTVSWLTHCSQANELRALAETHRKKLSRLNDDSEAGRQIYNLLLKCERDNDISGLEEAGQLLWGQVFQRPEADRSRDVTYENNDYETQDRGEFTYDNPTDFSDSDSIPEFSSSETSEDEESPVCSMDDSDLGAGSDEAFPTAPIDFPPASSLPCRQASTPTYGFSSRGSQTPHSSSRKGLLTAQKEKSSPATLVRS